MDKAVTFDGMDGSVLACPLINVWKDYGNRGAGIAATVAHEEKGVLLERKGNRCKVQVGDAVGYLTYYFLLELKADFQKKRLREEQADD